LTTMSSKPIFGIWIRASASPVGGGGGDGWVVVVVVAVDGGPGRVVVVVVDGALRTSLANCCRRLLCWRDV
jgi:hypothetical protein